jgi:hypothetical protein
MKCFTGLKYTSDTTTKEHSMKKEKADLKIN